MFDSLPLPNEPNRNLSDGSATYAYYIDSPNIGDILVQPQIKEHHTATVIMLHGADDSADEVKSSIEQVLEASFTFDDIQVLYPSAPVQSYTPLMGKKSHVWFNRQAVKASAEEYTQSVDEMAQKLFRFITDELVAKGTPFDRIIIGGYSMGGAMALHIAYRYCPQLAGVFTLSSFLNFDSAVYEDIKTKWLPNDIKLPPLFSCQGDNDEIVSFEDGEQTYVNLTAVGVKGQFHKFEGMGHEQWKSEILMLTDWIKEKLKNKSRKIVEEL